MNVVFGKNTKALYSPKSHLTLYAGSFVGEFNGYLIANSTVTKHDFQKSVDKLA